MIRWICTLVFRWSGWKFVDHIPPEIRTFVMIGAPHTSNWDFIPGMAVARLMRRNARFVIKQEWLRFPLGPILRRAGAVGVDRSTGKGNKTDAMAALFREYPELVLMISPEGTRKPTDEWKTGFYYIAQKAGVPIVLGFADYQTKTAGLGKLIYPKDLEADLREITDFYRGIGAAVPENFALDHRYR